MDTTQPTGAAETEPMTLAAALAWARTADAGDYLIAYEDTGLTHEEDPGSRCGFGDDELAELEAVLAERDLTLRADDRGLIAETTVTE